MKSRYNIVAIILMLSVASALTYVGELDNGAMVTSEGTYSMQINAKSNQMRINNMFGIQMFPTARVGGELVLPSTPVTPQLVPGQSVKEFVVTYPENFAQQVYVSSTVALEPEYVQHTITIENTDENEEKLIEIELLMSSTGTTYIYAPYKRNINAKYLLISPSYNMEKAEAMIVAFDDLSPSFEQQLEINVKPTLSKTLAWNLRIAPKSTQILNFKYSTGYVTDEALLQQSEFSPSISRQYLLNTGDDPLFNIRNAASLSSFNVETKDGMTASEMLAAISDYLEGLPDSVAVETSIPKVIDVTKVAEKIGTGLSSLEKTIAFRELARQNGLPAELHISYKDGEYYFWAVGFIGGNAYNFDPQNKKDSYQEVYVEPALQNCKGDDLTACPWSGGIRTDLLCIGDFCVSGFVLIALAALVFISLFAIFQYKTEFVYQILGAKREGAMLKGSLSGTYNVVDEKYEPQNPLEEAVYGELRRRSGVFNEIEYARTTGFSEPLVQSTLERFLDMGIVKRRY